MNKRERVMTVVAGGIPDRTPSGFWLHFPEGYEYGEEAAAIHVDFFKKTGIDICKVMNENLLPQDPSIKCVADWSHIKPFDKKSSFIQRQLDLIKRVTDSIAGEGVVLATVHGAAASISHILGGGAFYDKDKLLQVKHLRENPQGMRVAYEAVTEILQYLAEQSLLAGADGIYYAALGGETYGHTADEFDEYIRPSDLAILDAAKNRRCLNVLHICKDHIDLSRYADYPGDVVNWGVYSENLSLEEGRKIFKDRVILGGLDDRSGVLVDGRLEEIQAEVKRIVGSFDKGRFILGADCTLPTEIDYERIRCAVEAVN